MKRNKIFLWILRFVVLLILFFILFLVGAQAVNGMLPDITSEPGLVPAAMGALIVGITNTLLVMALILTSRWRGWKLAISLSLAYYGAVTLVTQIETWYFLSKLTVNAKLLPRLFLMGLPVAFLYVPLSVWILGRWRKSNDHHAGRPVAIPAKRWVIKLLVIAASYVILYWTAGYFIAWQNPELRAFYGSPGSIVPFWTHTVRTLRQDPGLFPFQILRAMIWTLCALPVIWGSKLSVGWTAILVGLFLSVPQNIAHILANPLLPLASVRFSHMIETASSTFIFGVLVTLLLHRNRSAFPNVSGLANSSTNDPIVKTGAPPVRPIT